MLHSNVNQMRTVVLEKKSFEFFFLLVMGITASLKFGS